MPTAKQMPKELESAIQQMLDDNVPEDDIKKVITKYEDQHDTTLVQTINELKGVVKGAASGAVGFVKSAITTPFTLPVSIYDDLIKAHDTGSLNDTNVSAMVNGLAEKIKSMPQEFADATHEERGKMIGNVVGGLLAAKYVPTSVKPVARGAGALVEAVGKKGAWPLRMMGSHQMGSGNPLGAAMIAAPEILQRTGQTLQRWGGKDLSTTLPSGARELDFGKVKSLPIRIQGRPEPVTVGGRVPLVGTPAEASGRVQKVMAKEAKDTLNAEKSTAIEESRAGLEAKKPTFSESVSATNPVGVRQSMVTRFGAAAAPVESELAKGLSPLQRTQYDALKTQFGQSVADSWLKKQVGVPTTTAVAEINQAGVPGGVRLNADGGPVWDSTAAARTAQQTEASAAGKAFLDPAAQVSGRALERRLQAGNAPEGVAERRAAAPAPSMETELLNRSLGINPGLKVTSVKPAGIEALRTEHGARETGEILNRAGVNPEISTLPKVERTNTIRDLSGGEAGLLPNGARMEIDKLIENMSPLEKQTLLTKTAPNAPAYNYIKSQIERDIQ